jgi:hypothetical protein
LAGRLLMTEAPPPKVFISYSHDTARHQERVLCLADRLRADGIEAEIDQYNDAPPEGWPLWCERQIKVANFVLMVCTETYVRRVSGDEERGKGLGAVWEAAIIRQLIYDVGTVSSKFVPVLFSDGSPEHIPTPIKGWSHYVVDSEEGYEALYRRLTGQPLTPRPELGEIRALPVRERRWAAASPTAPPPPVLHGEGLAGRLWQILENEKNRQVLGWLGGGAVIVAGGLWALVTFFYSPQPASQPSNVTVEAPGGVGAGGDIRGSTITVQPAPPSAPAAPPPPSEGR